MASEKEISNPQNEKKERQYKTDGGKTKSNAIEVPSVSLPKGGGAIKGIDQKFTVNAVNGTAAFSVPLPVSAARGVAPNLSISYNSGGGNGIFGLGWNLSLPSIKRKTDKELPQYHDYIDSDTYLLSEAEDLVPEFKRYTSGPNTGAFDLTSGDFEFNEVDSADTFWTIRFYKPRIEGLFARIERWTNKADGEIKWRVTTRDNMTTLYGWTVDARITDPLNDKRIYEWFPELVIDDKGNCAHYKYSHEDATGLDLDLLHNRNRYKSGDITYTNLYPDKILYGNITPYKQGDTWLSESDYMFQTVFDYGQYDSSAPYDLTGSWEFRTDAFSEYKAGFEIRTTRLCKRVLLFHYFTDLVDHSALVKSIDLVYDDSGEQDFTFLKSVTSTGYIRLDSSTYSSKSLPALEFTYQAHQWNAEVKEISTEDLLHAPVGLSNPYQFTDLYNEGLSGILSEQAGAWYYKRNLGEGNFEAAHVVSPKPSFSGLGGALQLLDLDGDGVKQIVNFNNSPEGYFEINDDASATLSTGAEFQRFKYFKNLPNINLNDPNTRLIDLNGDGKTDVLITEDTFFTWYESDGRNGFKERYRTFVTPSGVGASDEEDGPKLVFADQKQSIFLADMSGDGLVDLVRIRNGEVCYWPNLGYGNFGAKVGMDNAPQFDSDADFNPAYIKIADIDGSGTPDIIYLGKNKFTCWLNLSGNAFSTTPFNINAFPQVHNNADITVTDLLGNGLACIVWSSSLQKDAQAPLRYIDLMNSVKPHIMIAHINNLGKEVEMEYTPSTKYYIEDKLAGKPWATKLHFPVYCLSKVIMRDKVTGHVFTSNYTYHHGYFDHAEKEFRGFGRVDQTDTETAEHWTTEDATNLNDATVNQAPILTRSWFHTGAYLRDKKILDQFAQEYWYEELANAFPMLVFTQPEVELPPARILPDNLHANNNQYVDNITPIEKREALRACKSMPLRTEVFALDGTLQQQLTPYTVGTHNCMIEMLQPKGKNKYAVYCVKESEAITYSYERNTDDPRIAHTLNLQMDIYGNVLQSASVVYPRLVPDTALPSETQAAQAKMYVLVTENSFTNDVVETDNYRLRLPFEAKTYEIYNLTKAGDYYTLAEFDNAISSATAIPYSQLTPGSGHKKRLIEHVQSLYYKNDLTTSLSAGTLESLGIPYENYQLAYTNTSGDDLVTDIYEDRVGDPEMNTGNFLQIGTSWWIRSGTVQYITGAETITDAENRFFTPLSFTDPYNSVTTVSYDTNYFLFIEQTVDAVGNTASVLTFNYRTLTPVEMQDANDNISAVLLDELGLPKAMALYGKGTDADDLLGLTEETLSPEQADMAAYFTEAQQDNTDSDTLESYANALLLNATARFVYDFDCYKNSGGIDPAVVSTILREEHYQINPSSLLQLSFEYSGGSNNVVMKKMQAEPGLAKQVTVSGNTISVSSVYSDPWLRWIGNGRTVVNNKGNVIKQYEPFFSVSAKYESVKELVEQGVTAVMHYDAPGRLIRADYPDGTFTKVEFDSWKQIVYDQNDTCVDSSWFEYRNDLGSGPDYDAAIQASAHYNTPKTLHFDTLGRPVLEVEIHDSYGEFYTHLLLDVEGNLREVIDARGNTVMQYKYTMLGQMVYQLSMDSGERWLLHNVLGAPLYTWDQHNHRVEFAYDAVNRPLTVTVNGGPLMLNNQVESYEYGEGLTNDKLYNLRGKLYRHYDTGGLEEMATYDFKGNALSTERWLAADYKNTVDWALPSTLESQSFIISTVFDALGRIKEQTAPDTSVITPAYNRTGLLIAENVNHVAAGGMIPLMNVFYDAKGQRTYVRYGNDTETEYTYDEKSFRLTRLYTAGNLGVLQDLYFTYDAVGNITYKQDDNVPDVYYNNAVVQGINTYVYDSLYRLTQATGRENSAAITFSATDNWDDAPYKLTHNYSDTAFMQDYTQLYDYDEVGNILYLQHSAALGSYTRDYYYDTDSNRLLSTEVGANTYTYSHDTTHGFISGMPHLTVLDWNWKEEITATSKQLVTGGDIPETTYYQYDSKGRRLRKITEHYAAWPATPAQKDQRVYIEGFEYYEDFDTTDITETLSLIDGGQRFVMVENSTATDVTTRYQHPTHQGSCCLETNESGEIISYEEYHPFGTTSYQAMTIGVTAAAKRYRYTGMERDDESGLNYHNARYYIPWLGRWMNPDPIGIGDGINVYAYCRNNPVTYCDTSGTQTTKKTKQQMIESVYGTGLQIPTFTPFAYDHENILLDRLKGIPNAATSIVNGLIGIVNLGLYNSYMYTVLGPGGYSSAVGSYWQETEIPNAKKTINNTVDYFGNTHWKDVGSDALNAVGSPEVFEFAVGAFASYAAGGGNFKLGNNSIKANFSKPKTTFKPKTKSLDSGKFDLDFPATAPEAKLTQRDIFSLSIETRGNAEIYALQTKYRGFQNANQFVKNNPVFDLFDAASGTIVDVTTTTLKKLSPTQFYKKLDNLSNLDLPGATNRILQIYVKEGQYNAKEIAELTTKLDNYIADFGLTSKFEINTISKNR